MKTTKYWDHLVQILIVIFGVFLGMLLTEWNADRKDKLRQKAVLNQILKEVEDHQNQLTAVIPYHKTLTKTVDSVMNRSSMEELNADFLVRGGWSHIPNWQGIKLFRLPTSGYETAKISNILSGVDSHLLETITTYYEHVDTYNRFSEKITDRMFDFKIDTKVLDAFILVQILKGDILGLETSINKSSQELADQLD